MYWLILGRGFEGSIWILMGEVLWILFVFMGDFVYRVGDIEFNSEDEFEVWFFLVCKVYVKEKDFRFFLGLDLRDLNLEDLNLSYFFFLR